MNPVTAILTSVIVSSALSVAIVLVLRWKTCIEAVCLRR